MQRSSMTTAPVVSETPRTDEIWARESFRAEAITADRCGGTLVSILRDHARTLERELAEAKKDAKRFRLGLQAVLQWADHPEVVRRHAEAALDAAIAKGQP